MSSQTLTQKILSRNVGHNVLEGEIIFPEPDLVVVHDWYSANAGRTLRQFGNTFGVELTRRSRHKAVS